MNIQRKRGSVKLSKQYMYDAHQDLLEAIFSQFYPMAIDYEHQYGFTNEIRYWGLSAQFEDVPEGCVTPEYLCEVIYDNEEEEYIISFNKI